ncbi:30S ribosomal protein S6 [bacterium]
MKNYEVVFAVSPKLLKDEQDANLNKITSKIENGQGIIDNVEEWGLKKLAYPIKDCYEAFYYRIQFQADPCLISNIKENIRLNENIIRHIIIVLDNNKHKKIKTKEKGGDTQEQNKSNV